MTAYKIQVAGYEIGTFEYDTSNTPWHCACWYMKWHDVDLNQYLDQGQVPFKYSWQDENTDEWCEWRDDVLPVRRAFLLNDDFYLTMEN